MIVARGRVHPGSSGAGRVAGQTLAVAVGFFFGNTELSLELWNVIAEISGVDASLPAVLASSNMLECRDYLFLVAN